MHAILLLVDLTRNVLKETVKQIVGVSITILDSHQIADQNVSSIQIVHRIKHVLRISVSIHAQIHVE